MMRAVSNSMNTDEFAVRPDRYHLLCLLIALLWGSLLQPARADWYVEAGPWYRGDMRVRVDGGSQAAAAGLRLATPGVQGAFPVASDRLYLDAGTAQVLRQYENGFVGPSSQPLFSADGVTPYFGYDDASQYDAAAQTLTFTWSASAEQTGRQTHTRVDSDAPGWSQRRSMDGVGLLGTVGYTVRRESAATWSLQAQAGWLGGMDVSLRGRQAYEQAAVRTSREQTLTQTQQGTAVFDTLGNPAFPEAPYAMTDPAGVGPMIADTPSAINTTASDRTVDERLVDRSRRSARSMVDMSSEADLFMVSLGPRLMWEVGERFALLVQGGVTLNLFDVSLSRAEVFQADDGRVLEAWYDRQDRQEWLWGASAVIGGRWGLWEHTHLQAGVGYDWVERVTIAVGPDRARYDLSGYRVDLAVSREF